MKLDVNTNTYPQKMTLLELKNNQTKENLAVFELDLAKFANRVQNSFKDNLMSQEHLESTVKNSG